MTNPDKIVKKDKFQEDVENAEYWVFLTSLLLIACFTGFVSTTLILR